MLEGTRNEKVAIVVSSYVIGFTTAFIAFGINQLYMTNEVLTAYAPVHQEDVVELPESISQVILGEDGLSVVTANGPVLLSAKSSSLGASLISAVETPGFHFAIIDAEPSRDGQFVYFCEQLSESNETCDPYIYSLRDESLHRITVNTESFKPEVSEHTSSWTQNGLLIVNGNASQDAKSPWNLTASEASKETTNEEVEVVEDSIESITADDLQLQ